MRPAARRCSAVLPQETAQGGGGIGSLGSGPADIWSVLRPRSVLRPWSVLGPRGESRGAQVGDQVGVPLGSRR
jgi:hypothetical protein